MRVKIGNYINWIGPYQIAAALFFWYPKKKDEFGIKRPADFIHNFGCWLAEDKNGNDSWLNKFCSWVHSKRKRTIKVKLDRWDTWNVDSTLAIIILPLLKQLNEKKHGAPCVDDQDVPEGIGLRSSEAPPKENDYDTDDNHFKRWDWVLNELIWTFEQLHPECDWESQYHTGEIDIKWVVSKVDENNKPLFHTMERGPKDTHKFDLDGYQKHSARINNGLMLFGKYYRALWD